MEALNEPREAAARPLVAASVRDELDDEPADQDEIADRVQAEITSNAAALRAKLSEVADAISEVEVAAAGGDLAGVLDASLRLVGLHRDLGATYDGWFSSVGHMSNIGPQRLGALGDEIDLFLADLYD